MADIARATARLARLARPLGWWGECRLWLMYRYDLATEPAPLRQPPSLEISLASSDEMEEVAALFHPDDAERIDARARMYRERLASGSLCFVARADEGIVSSNWIRVGSAIGAHGVRMHLADDEIYTTDAYTAHAWRGHGLHPALNRAMLVHARRLGFRVAFTLVRADNLRSAVALPRVGWHQVGALLYWQPRRVLARPVWLTAGAIHPMRKAAPETAMPHTDGVALPELLARYAQREPAGARPWSNLYRLEGEPGVAWLKIVAPVQAPLLRLSSLLADEFADTVPPVIAFDSSEPAWLLLRDHGAEPVRAEQAPGALASLLACYATLQARAVRQPLLLAAAPLFEVAGAWQQLAALLEDNDGALADLVGEAAVRAARDALAPHRQRLSNGWRAAEALPLTLEHGKLGIDNAALTADGRWVLTSWNDACTGPPGLSLYRLFGGCVRTLRLFEVAAGRALADPDAATDVEDAAALVDYLDALVNAGLAERSMLQQALPGAITLGPVVRLLTLAGLDNEDPPQRAALQVACSELLDELVELAGYLANQPDPDRSEAERSGGTQVHR